MNQNYLPTYNQTASRSRTDCPNPFRAISLHAATIFLFLFSIVATAQDVSSKESDDGVQKSGDCVPTIWYRDYDGDGYGSEYNSVMACIQPAGYVANNTDCDDYNPNKNPGMPEIYYNGIDDNCNVSIDDGAMILTKVQSQFCGATLAALDTKVFVDVVSSATAYRFDILDISNGVIQTVITSNPFIKLTDMPQHAYNKTYRISVMVQRYFVPGNINVWLGYFGPPCFVSTPDTPSTASLLVLNQCGSVIGSSGTVTSPAIFGATQYRYMVKRHLNDNAPIITTQSSPSFNINQLIPFTYGATYYVAVAAKLASGQFTSYGAFCPVYTTSTDVLKINQCNVHFGSIYFYVSVDALPMAIEYSFDIKNAVNGAQQFITSSMPRFHLNQITNLQSNTEYQITVSVRTAGGWSEFGPKCSIYSPLIGIKIDTKPTVEAEFKTVASPNPFSSSFALKITEGATGTAEVKVYDMIGKLLESWSVESSELSTHHFGAQFPTGVYNVVVTQGEKVNTLKVVKR